MGSIFLFDPLYFLFLAPALLLMVWAQWKVRSTYRKYSQVQGVQGITGVQAAQRLLRSEGLGDIAIEGTPGELTDHYDPRHRTLRLSRGVYNSSSVAAIGIVAHEVGHAIQHQRGYVPMRLRGTLVPYASVGSQLGPWLVVLGLFVQFAGLVWLGVLLFAAAFLFSLATLPVELDASRRARAMLTLNGLVTLEERQAASQVLTAAALTYVATLAVATMQLVYFVLRALGMGRRD